MTMFHFFKGEYNWIVSLQRKQKLMLKGKEEALSELYKICTDDIQKDLIKDLIIRFTCLSEEPYNEALIKIAKHISSLQYQPETTAIIAFCKDSISDSSQVIVDDIKVPLAKIIGKEILPINNFMKLKKTYDHYNIRHFIAIDDFSGSGKTIIERYKHFINLGLKDATIDFCLIASMEEALEKSKEVGFTPFVVYTLKKGISDYYEGNKLQDNNNSMIALESRLADKIGKTELSEMSYGYGKAESLFTRLNRNIPNNVFPIFWWKEYHDHKKRVTLFDRVQDGY